MHVHPMRRMWLPGHLPPIPAGAASQTPAAYTGRNIFPGNRRLYWQKQLPGHTPLLPAEAASWAYASFTGRSSFPDIRRFYRQKQLPGHTPLLLAEAASRAYAAFTDRSSFPGIRRLYRQKLLPHYVTTISFIPSSFTLSFSFSIISSDGSFAAEKEGLTP